MTPSSLRAGKTYVGKNGRRRYIIREHIDWILYDVPEGRSGSCSIRAFARWAEREATAEEAPPPTGELG